MKGQVQEIRGTKSEDVIPGVKNVLPELGNTNLEEKCSGNTSSQSDDDTDKELQRFAHLLIENCSGGNEQSDGTVEKELQKFAHLLIEETTDLYYRTKCSSEGITTSNPWGLKPISNLRASENLTIANKKRQHDFQDYENVEETKVISENTISNFNENEHLHRKTKFTDIIGKTDNVGFRHRNDKNGTRQQQSTCRPVRKCDPFLWQPESNDLQENITLESVDKHYASTKVNPNASSSIKDNGNSSDYNYVLAEDDLLLPGILSSEENSACVDNDQMRIEKDDMSNDEDMPILRRETTFHRVDKITNVENLAQNHVNDVIETRAIGVGIKCVTYDKNFIGGHSESELEDSAESSVQVDKELGETKCGHASQKKYYQHVVGSDSNESKCLNTKISNQIIYKQNEPGNQQTSKQVKTHSVKVSLPRNVFECLAGIDNQVRNTSEESIIGQTFEPNDAKNNMRHGSEYELEHRFSQVGKEIKKEQIHEQNVIGNTIDKTLANEVECTAGSFGRSIRGPGNVANQQTYEKGASRGIMENSSSNKSKSIADSSSQLEESTNEQADANVDSQDLKINDYEYEMECLADSSTQVEENASEQAGECSDAHSRKGPVNELECTADKSNTLEEKKKISRQTIQNTSRIESVDSENLADSSSRSEVNIGKQSCEHAQFLVRNNTANEDDCLEDSSTQMSKGQDDFACGSVYEAKSTKDDTRSSDNEVSLIQKIGALDLNNSSKGNELKSKPKHVSYMSGTRIMLSRKNINDMNRASIKNVTRETTCIFSLKSYRKVRPCSSSADFLLYICSGSDVLKNPLTFETSDERLSGTFKSPDSNSSSIERRRLNKGLGCSLFVKKKISMRKREDGNAINGCDSSCSDSNKRDINDELDHLNKRSIESVKAAHDHSNLKSEMDTDRPEQHPAVTQTEKVAKSVPENQPEKHDGSSKYSSVDSITNMLHDIAVTGGENKSKAVSLGTSFNMKFLEFIGASSNPVKHENLEDNDGIAVDTVSA